MHVSDCRRQGGLWEQLVRFRDAPTVTGMLFIVVGIVLGLGIALGPVSVLSSPVASVSASIVEYGSQLAAKVLELASALPHTETLILLATPLAGVAVPGFMALSLAFVVKGSDALRRAFAVLVLIAAAFSFVVLSPGKAFSILVLAGAFAALSSLVSGVIVKLPLATLISAMAATIGLQMFHGTNPAIAKTVASFVEFAPATSPEVWQLLLSVTGVAPFVAAVWMLIRD